MGRRLIRVTEALRRAVGKPGRRTGVQQRKGLEVKRADNRFEYSGVNPRGGPEQMVIVDGVNQRSGVDRRKKTGILQKLKKQ